jgi:2-hydroxy-6-oxonona-2,4-dienedioate hydrolase
MNDSAVKSIWNNLIGQEIKQTFYRAGNIRTRAIESGTGEPLIFLHGTGGHAEAYARNIIAHAQYFRVFAIDMVGHGFSDKPKDLDYKIDDFVNHLKDFIDALNVKKVNLSGESLGAFVALHFTHKFPELVNRLVLNTGIPGPWTEKGYKDLEDMLERSRAAAQNLTKEAVRKRLEWLMADPNDVTEELVETRHFIYSRPGAAEIMKKITESVVNSILETRHNPKAQFGDESILKSIQHDTLVLWTKHNPAQYWEDAQKAAANLPNHRFYLMEDAGHWPQWEKADEFNRVHLNFLRFGIQEM